MSTPWNIATRPMPSSADPSVLCPPVVGPFRRMKIDGQMVLDTQSVYVHYANGASTIFMEVAVNTQPAYAHATLETAAGEAGGTIQGSEPKWLGSDGFFAWTRGGWFFSANALGGAAELDAFMRAFPF